MAYEIAQAVKLTLVAGADLSTHQYKFVKINASAQVVLCSAATDIPIGVLQNSPRATEEAEICVIGGTKVVASGALTTGTVVATNASGLAAASVAGTNTTFYAAGQVIKATGAANEIATILINCASAHRAA